MLESQESVDKLSGGTLGIQPAVEEEKKSNKFMDEEGKEHSIDDDGDLPKIVLESLLKIDPETVAQNRGDYKFIDKVTNQHVIEMIQDLKSLEQANASENAS